MRSDHSRGNLRFYWVYFTPAFCHFVTSWLYYVLFYMVYFVIIIQRLVSVAVAESIFLCHKEIFNTFSLRLVKTKETWLFARAIFIKRMKLWCLGCAHGWTVFTVNLSPQTMLPFSVMEDYCLYILRLHMEQVKFVWRTRDWNVRNLQCLHLEADVLMDQKTV